jgi:transposase
MRPHGSPKALERRRIRAIAMIEKGMLPVEVARVIGVDRRSVRRWKSLFRAKGIQALKAKAVPGRLRA